MATAQQVLQTQITAWFQRRTHLIGARRVAPISAALATDVGNSRNENQDRVAAIRGSDPEGQEFVLAAVTDGIGGMRDGSTCAALALGSFIASIYKHLSGGSIDSQIAIRQAVKDANCAIHEKFRETGGATLAATLLRPNGHICWVSVGDSRVYQLCGREINQVSIDDTIAGQLAKPDPTGREQEKLLQYIGMGADLEPHIEIFNKVPDFLLLTTDGAHYFAKTADQLGRLVIHAADPAIAAKRISDVAKWYGGPDNGTVAVIDLRALSFAARDPQLPRQVLEIWDPFGEFQLHPIPGHIHGKQPVNESRPSTENEKGASKDLEAELPPPEPEEASRPSSASSIVPDQAVDKNSDGTEEGNTHRRQKKTRPRNKGSRRNIRSKKKQEDHEETPQLVVEFPDKSQGGD